MNHSKLMVGALLTTGIVIGGCGGGGSSDVDKVKQTVITEFHALANGDGATACAQATPDAQAKLAARIPGGGTCQQAVQKVSALIPPTLKQGMLNVQINAVTINGDTARIKDQDITTTKGSLAGFLGHGGATVLKKQSDGSWKLSTG